MKPYITDVNKAMGGTKEAYQDMLRKDKRLWAELKRKSRRKKRRLDKLVAKIQGMKIIENLTE